MASQDPLQLLRNSISASKEPFLTKSGDPSTAEGEKTSSWVEATHLYFSHPSPLCLLLDAPTRFVAQQPEEAQVDLRSAFFAWNEKDKTVPEYIANATELDKQLPEGQKIQNLVFVERLDLITWLEGASEDSEYIKPLEGVAADEAANKAADVAGGAGVPTVSGTGVGVTQQTAGGRPIKVIDARLQAIYNGERKMGDHNSVLRGIKPTVCNLELFVLIHADKHRTSATSTSNVLIYSAFANPPARLATPDLVKTLTLFLPDPLPYRTSPLPQQSTPNDPIPLSFSPHPPHHSSAYLTSNPSSSKESMSQLIIPNYPPN